MDNITYLNAYEEAALVKSVNSFNSELENFRVGIFLDGPHDIIRHSQEQEKNTSYRFEVQFKWAATSMEPGDKELQKVHDVVAFLNSFHFVRDLQPVSDKGITKQESIKLRNAFEKAIKNRNAETIIKILGTVKDE